MPHPNKKVPFHGVVVDKSTMSGWSFTAVKVKVIREKTRAPETEKRLAGQRKWFGCVGKKGVAEQCSKMFIVERGMVNFLRKERRVQLQNRVGQQ